MPSLDSLYRTRSGLWAPYYAILEQQLGATATLLNFGNIGSAGQPTATTWTGRRFNASGLAPVWTPSEALSAFDTPFNLKLESNWLGLAPILTFNGTDEEADTPDAAYWTRIDAVFSIGAWVNTNTSGTHPILGKWTTTAGREWLLRINAGQIQLFLGDESVTVFPDRAADAAYAANAWHSVVITKGTGTGATAMNDVIIYIDGSSVASTATNSASFVGMEDGTGLPNVGRDVSNSQFFTGKMLGGPWSPFFVQAELTPAQVANIYQNMRLGLGI